MSSLIIICILGFAWLMTHSIDCIVGIMVAGAAVCILSKLFIE